MKAQYALEYLIIMGIAILIIVPTVYIFFNYSKESKEELIYPQITEIARNILSNAESVYFSGEHSRVILQVDMPERVNNITILHNRELVFNISTEAGDNEIIFFSDINITTDDDFYYEGDKAWLSYLHDSGIKKIRIESINDGKQVLINYTR